MTDNSPSTFTPAAPPASPEAGLLLLRTPFPANQVSLLPRNVRKVVQGEDRWQCVPGRPDSSKASKDGRFCGGYHAASIHLDYVGHAAVTDRLLDADPAWTWDPVAWSSDGFPRFDAEGGIWIRLTVQDVTRLGYGDAQGKKGPNATKEAIGDAIRNAAMRFGVALDLWHKGDLHDPTEAAPTGSAPEVLVRDWLAEAANLTTFDAVRALWGEARAGGANAAILDQIVERGNELAAIEEALKDREGAWVQTVWKTVTPVDSEVHGVDLPGNARLLRVEAVGPHAVGAWWYVADSRGETRPHHLTVSGTGQLVPSAWQILGTAPIVSLGLVWHLWRVPSV